MGKVLSKDWWNDGLDDEDSYDDSDDEEEERMRTALGCGFSLNVLNDGSLAATSDHTLKCHFHILEQDATTRISLRARPRMRTTNATDEDRYWHESNPWFVTDYCSDANQGKQNMHISGKVDEILLERIKSLTEPPISKLVLVTTTLTTHFRFINECDFDGRVWWNGFTMKLIGDPSTRLELTDIQMDPLGLTFKNPSVEEIEVVRSVERLELIGKPSGSELGDSPRAIRIYGPDVSMIEATLKDGSILLTFPPYQHNPDVELVWPDYYYSV